MNDKIIYARDAKIGESYLTDGLHYKVRVVNIYGEPPNVSSVLVESEYEHGRRVNIAGGTELIPYSEELHKVPVNPVLNKQQTSKESSMPRQKNPRSAIIDQELLKTVSGTEPDWEAIATLVIENGRAPEEKRKAVISQAKTRYKWYTEEGKTNPLAPTEEAPVK